MIVIRASGKTDVRALRKLATQLSADEVEVAPQEVEAVTRRRDRKPLVSTLAGAKVSAETQSALMDLRSVEGVAAGEYDFT